MSLSEQNFALDAMYRAIGETMLVMRKLRFMRLDRNSHGRTDCRATFWELSKDFVEFRFYSALCDIKPIQQCKNI